MGERLEAMFAACESAGRAALLPFLTAGLPTPEHAVDMFTAMAEAGADGFEVGIPYSDPLMDGPVIQAAAARALAAGMTLGRSFEVVSAVAAATGKPVLVMTYINPVLRAGPGEFARRAAAAGACGVIVADLPVEEAGPVQEAVEAAGMGMVLFAAPTTGADRLRRLAAARPAFVYGVADLGVTGERTGLPSRVADLAAAVRAGTGLRLVLGVGIATPDQAGVAAAYADGVIVGSALVRRVLEAADPGAAARDLGAMVAAFAAAMRRVE